jgi:hypothetical protein
MSGRWLPALGVALALVLTGCGTSGEGPMAAPMEQRPTIEEVEPVYLAMMAEIQRVLSDDFGVGTWVQHRERVSGSSCGSEAADGVRRSYNLGSAGAIAEEDWGGALAAVREIVAEHGFTEVVEVIDRSRDHLVDIDDADGARVSFGTKDATVLRVTTGCHR